MSNAHEPTPEWLVERLAADELPEAKARELQGRAALQEQLEQIARSNAELLAQHPPAEVAHELERRLLRGKRASARRPALWLGAVAAMSGALFLFARDAAAPAPSGAEQVAPRGLQPHIVVFRKAGSGAERLSDRARVRAGDMLQLAYVSAGRKYGVIASIDGRGAITLHLPERADMAVQLSGQGQSALPHAFELDDTPGVERFVFVSADHPFATQIVSDALRAGSRLDAHYTLSEISLEKQP